MIVNISALSEVGLHFPTPHRVFLVLLVMLLMTLRWSEEVCSDPQTYRLALAWSLCACIGACIMVVALFSREAQWLAPVFAWGAALAGWLLATDGGDAMAVRPRWYSPVVLCLGIAATILLLVSFFA